MPKNQKTVGSWMLAQPQLLGVPAGGQLLVYQPKVKNIIQNFLKSIKKKLDIKIKMTRSWMCVQHQSLVVPIGDQILVLLHCAKVALDVICYENRSTFYSIVPGGKEKNLFSKC